VSIVATLVIGADGSSSLNGTSAAVTSAADRENFLKRRRQVDCIIIGGNTARAEPYSKTPAPLVIISRQLHPQLPAAHVWDCDPLDALSRAREEFGENILIEGGASFISYLLDKNAIDVLELSVTASSGGHDVFQSAKYLASADSVEEKTIDGTIFYSAKFMRQK
jgi:riboflavin biosynthesis pyrimidine reductase